MTALSYPHIEMSADGVPMIAGTPTKVVEVVLDHLAHDLGYTGDSQATPASQHEPHPRGTDYYDHQPEMDADIARRAERVDEIKAVGESPLRAKLK